MRCLFLLALVLAACNGNPNGNLAKELDTTFDHDGKEIEVTGDFNFGSSVTVEDDVVVTPFIWQGAYFVGKDETVLAAVEMPFGRNGKNQMYVPQRWKSTDVEIRDDQGVVHGYTDHFKLRGRVEYLARDTGKHDYVVRDVHITAVPFSVMGWIGRYWVIAAVIGLAAIGLIWKVVDFFRGVEDDEYGRPLGKAHG